MANFPTSPTVGEQFSTSKVTYRWNGSAWDIVEGVKQGTIQDNGSPVGSLQFTEGNEPDTVANSSSIYATSSGMFVKNSSGTVSPLIAGASATTTSVELPTITSAPSGIDSTGQMVHWDRSGESTPDGNVKLLLTGDTSTDGSQSSHSISYNGSTTTSTEQAKYGSKSIKFSGSTVSIADSEDWNFGSGDWTAECWVYLNGTGGQGIINQSNPGASSNSSMIIWLDGTVGIYVSSGAGWTYNNINSNSLSSGQWIHLAAVRYGTSLKMYVNGTATSDTTLPSNWSLGNSSLAFELGAQAGGSPLSGYMDDVRITKAAQYTGNFTPPTAQLTASTAGGTSGLYYVAPDGTATLIKEDS